MVAVAEKNSKSKSSNKSLLKKNISLREIMAVELEDKDFAKSYRREKLISQISSMVYEARTSMGLTQRDLAKKINSSQSAIARLENGSGDRITSLDLLYRIAEVLELKIELNFVQI
mgnify:CR=1 FL=1